SNSSLWKPKHENHHRNPHRALRRNPNRSRRVQRPRLRTGDAVPRRGIGRHPCPAAEAGISAAHGSAATTTRRRMSMHHVLTFIPDGTGRCLYTEAVDLSAIGPLEIRRASTIEHNAATQLWEVRDPQGALLYQHANRSACLAWEHRYFNR